MKTELQNFKIVLGLAAIALVVKLWAVPPPGGNGNSVLRSNLNPPPPPVSGDPCTGCTNETFEGAGYSVAGWSEGGGGTPVVNEDSAVGYAPIIGSQSLFLQNDAFDAAYTEHQMPQTAEVWVRFAVVFSNTVPNMRFAYISDNVANVQAALELRGGKIRVVAGTAQADTVASYNVNKTNYIWFHYKQVTGVNNDEADVGFAEHPTKTRPTSGNNFASLNTGSANALQSMVGLTMSDIDFSGIVGDAIYDNISITTLGAIGDFP